jgi:hypothetical protein
VIDMRLIWIAGAVAPIVAGAWLLTVTHAKGPREVPSAAEVQRLLQRGGARNVAVTADRAIDPRLQPRRIPAPPALVQAGLADALAHRTRWRVAGSRDGVLWATHTTRVLRFVDDVFVLIVPADGETRLYARSASRVGRDDLGQNRRNLGELWQTLDDWLAHHVAPMPEPGPARAVTASRDADS